MYILTKIVQVESISGTSGVTGTPECIRHIKPSIPLGNFCLVCKAGQTQATSDVPEIDVTDSTRISKRNGSPETLETLGQGQCPENPLEKLHFFW